MTRLLGVLAGSVTLSPLNAIVDVEVAERAGWTPIDLAAAYLSGGARFLQIRAKTLSGAAFLDLASRICEMAHRCRRDRGRERSSRRRPVVRAPTACTSGQDDLPAAAARAIVGVDAIVGLSTHTEPQIEAARRAAGDAMSRSVRCSAPRRRRPVTTRVGLDRVRYAADATARSRRGPRGAGRHRRHHPRERR